MLEKNPLNKALADMEWQASVVDSKMKFFPRDWAKYELAKPGTQKLVLPEYLMASLQRDYAQMRGMIFWDYPRFQEI